MTTYAFDGKNFASDSQCTHKKMDSLQTRPKLVEIEHEDRVLFMGIVGETNVHPVVQSHIEDLCLENRNLTSNSFYLRLVEILQKHKLLEQSDVILYSPHTNSVYEFYQTNGTYGYHKWTTPIAFGSGAQCAMGVLALGITADYAVVAAGKVDIFTNGPFYYIEEANDYQLSLLESADLIMPERWSEMHSDFFDTFRKV